jgi:hypothetical protein
MQTNPYKFNSVSDIQHTGIDTNALLKHGSLTVGGRTYQVRLADDGKTISIDKDSKNQPPAKRYLSAAKELFTHRMVDGSVESRSDRIAAALNKKHVPTPRPRPNLSPTIGSPGRMKAYDLDSFKQAEKARPSDYGTELNDVNTKRKHNAYLGRTAQNTLPRQPANTRAQTQSRPSQTESKPADLPFRSWNDFWQDEQGRAAYHGESPSKKLADQAYNDHEKRRAEQTSSQEQHPASNTSPRRPANSRAQTQSRPSQTELKPADLPSRDWNDFWKDELKRAEYYGELPDAELADKAYDDYEKRRAKQTSRQEQHPASVNAKAQHDHRPHRAQSAPAALPSRTLEEFEQDEIDRANYFSETPNLSEASRRYRMYEFDRLQQAKSSTSTPQTWEPPLRAHSAPAGTFRAFEDSVRGKQGRADASMGTPTRPQTLQQPGRAQSAPPGTFGSLGGAQRGRGSEKSDTPVSVRTTGGRQSKRTENQHSGPTRTQSAPANLETSAYRNFVIDKVESLGTKSPQLAGAAAAVIESVENMFKRGEISDNNRKQVLGQLDNIVSSSAKKPATKTQQDLNDLRYLLLDSHDAAKQILKSVNNMSNAGQISADGREKILKHLNEIVGSGDKSNTERQQALNDLRHLLLKYRR